MADYQNIVEQIRGFLQASDQTRNDRLDNLAANYVEACTEVNQRLGRCHRLLQQGLRSEAIQLAESEPRLLDAVEMLDFPERNEWDELVEIYSLAGAPKLVVEPRTALSEAYAEAQPLQNLLRTHRRMATQRAPLRQRIGVMRKLAFQDAGNSIWSDDLRSFEKARFRQIQAEAAEAIRLQDSAQLTRLMSELQEPAWTEAPPKSLVQGLAKADAQLRRELSRSALAEIEARLSDAQSASDPVRGRAARDDWTKLTATVPVEPGDSCWARVTPALEWLAEEDRKAVATEAYETDLAALSSALDDRRDISAGELERLEGDVLRHGRGMPDKLQRRYATRFRSAATVRSRRLRIIVAAVSIAVVVLGVFGYFEYRNSARAQDAEKAAATVAALVEKRDFEEAESFLENLERVDATLLTLPVLVEARKRCKIARNAETERIRNFEAALQEAKGAPLNEIEPKALALARSLAELESETRLVDQLTEQREVDRKTENQKRDSSLLPRLDSIIRETDQLALKLDSMPRDLSEIQQELESLQQGFSSLQPDVAAAGDEPRRVAGELKRRLETITGRLDRRQTQARLKDEITGAVGFSIAEQSDNLTRFASRLREFTQANPNEPCSAAFKQTLKEQPLWDAVADWNALVAGWKSKGAALTPQEADARGNACGEFLAKYPGFAGIKDIEAYRSCMQPIARRYRGQDSPAASLRKTLSIPSIEHTWMVEMKSEFGQQFPTRYYPEREPTPKGSSIVFSIVYDGKPLVKTLELASITSWDRSPQSKIAARFKPLFIDHATMERGGGWDSNLIELVRTIISDRNIDPVPQLLLLKSVVRAAGQGSEPFRVSQQALSEQLEKSKVVLNVDWTNPYARHLSDSQNGSREVIETLRKAMPRLGQVQKERGRLERAASLTYRTTGWLFRDNEGYKLQTGGGAMPRGGDLCVIAPAGEKGAAWLKVGAVAGGKLELDKTNKSALVEGRPVFVIEEVH